MAKNLTQEALAKAVGVTKATVSNHERGETEPDEDQVQQYCEALGLTPARLRYEMPFLVREAQAQYSAEVPVRTTAAGMPLSVREFIQEELLAYTRAGVSEEEIEHARALFTSPQLLVFYKGGPREMSEEDMMKDVKAYSVFLRTVFKERGYKPL